jgi:hypothetical protein
MKAYLFTTGALFAVLALAHLARTFAEASRLRTEPGFIPRVLALASWRRGSRSGPGGCCA